ncbi:MAG: hypothetical protein QOG85_1859 [Gaiellaceae bacterium]|nr:hypothetical protein [Gaiellaceae bacterium]
MSEANPHVLLVGHPPATEFLGYVTTQTLEGRGGNEGAFMDAWRRANDHLLELADTEAGYADAIELGAMPEELAPLVEAALADPVMRRDYALAPVSIEWVELDRLVVVQWHINLAFAEELRAELGDSPSSERIFEFALPYEKRRDPPVQAGQTGEASWTFTSVSNDFRVLSAELLEPEQVSGIKPGGVPSKFVALRLGYGSNYFSALSVGSRLVLHNGSHRAYALRAAGQTHVPCLVQHVSRHEELRAIVGDGHPLMSSGDNVLTTPRPPLFKDYFDERLRMIVHVPAALRQVQVGFNLNVTDLPA